VPISPAFHYANGGIACDTRGRIPGMRGLYVAGEAARTGVHGANRLASNSLLEAAVFAKRCAEEILGSHIGDGHIPDFEKDYDTQLRKENDKMLKYRLRDIMWKDVGIMRTDSGLHEAKNFIYDTKNRDVGGLLQLRLNTAAAIVEAALSRRESLGAHYIEKLEAAGAAESSGRRNTCTKPI